MSKKAFLIKSGKKFTYIKTPEFEGLFSNKRIKEAQLRAKNRPKSKYRGD